MSTTTTRIHESIDTALARKRVVLWYDPSGEWAAEFDDYQPAQAEKRRVEGNEFSLKVVISRAPSISASCFTFLAPNQPSRTTGCSICSWPAMSSAPTGHPSTL